MSVTTIKLSRPVGVFVVVVVLVKLEHGIVIQQRHILEVHGLRPTEAMIPGHRHPL